MIETHLGVKSNLTYDIEMAEEHLDVYYLLFKKLLEFRHRKGWVNRLEFDEDEVFMMHDFVNLYNEMFNNKENGVQE